MLAAVAELPARATKRTILAGDGQVRRQTDGDTFSPGDALDRQRQLVRCDMG